LLLLLPADCLPTVNIARLILDSVCYARLVWTGREDANLPTGKARHGTGHLHGVAERASSVQTRSFADEQLPEEAEESGQNRGQEADVVGHVGTHNEITGL
jgi:hypothetical protein